MEGCSKTHLNAIYHALEVFSSPESHTYESSLRMVTDQVFRVEINLNFERFRCGLNDWPIENLVILVSRDKLHLDSVPDRDFLKAIDTSVVISKQEII